MAASSSSKQSDYARSVFRPNLSGTAYQRHQAYIRDVVSVYGGKTSDASSSRSVHSTTEFDILKEKHEFIRQNSKCTSWEDALAMKYESSLFKEFAVCDLKHYKTGNVALRWRTEVEVLSGAGEETCGNTRCAYHEPQTEHVLPPLTTLEVPFAYSEQGQAKSALVKLVLCERCSNKLLWKRRKEKAVMGGKKAEHIASSGDEGKDISDADAEPSTSRQLGTEQRRSRSTDRRDHDAIDHRQHRRAERIKPTPGRMSRTQRDDVVSERHSDRRRRRQSRSISLERRSASPERHAKNR